MANVIDLCLVPGEHQRAARHLESALTQFTGDGHFLARRVILQPAMRGWAAAEGGFSQLLSDHPDIHTAYNLTLALQAQARHEEAYTVLEPYLAAPILSAPKVIQMLRSLHHK